MGFLASAQRRWNLFIVLAILGIDQDLSLFLARYIVFTRFITGSRLRIANFGCAVIVANQLQLVPSNFSKLLTLAMLF